MAYTMDQFHADLKRLMSEIGIKYPEDALKATIKSRAAEDLIADAEDGAGRSTLVSGLKDWAYELEKDTVDALDVGNYPSNLRHKLETKLMSEILPKLVKLAPAESIVTVDRLVERVLRGESPERVYASVTEADEPPEWKRGDPVPEGYMVVFGRLVKGHKSSSDTSHAAHQASTAAAHAEHDYYRASDKEWSAGKSDYHRGTQATAAKHATTKQSLHGALRASREANLAASRAHYQAARDPSLSDEERAGHEAQGKLHMDRYSQLHTRMQKAKKLRARGF